MSESKSSRPLSEIQQEFNQLCFQAGRLNYQRFCIEKDLGMINDRLREVNVEAAAAQKAAEAAEAATPAPALAAVPAPVETTPTTDAGASQ